VFLTEFTSPYSLNTQRGWHTSILSEKSHFSFGHVGFYSHFPRLLPNYGKFQYGIQMLWWLVEKMATVEATNVGEIDLKLIPSKTLWHFEIKERHGHCFNTCTVQLLLLCTMDQETHTIISQIITLLHVSTLSCHPQAVCNQYLAKLHQYFKCSCR